MMNRTLLIILAVLALGSAGFGLAQLNDARKLRENLAALDQERAALQKRLWDLQKRNGDLERRLARPATTAAAESDAGGDLPPGGGPAADGLRGRGRPDFRNFAAALNNPEVQKLLAVQQKAGLDGHYAALFKKLNLSPADLEKFKDLLVERQSAVMDVLAATRAEGLNGPQNRDQIRQLVQDAQGEVDNTIRSTLGDAAYSQYQIYEANVPQRNVVSQLEQRLSYSTTPLTDTQSSQMVQILAESAPTNSNSQAGGAGLPRFFVGAGAGPAAAFVGGAAPITNDAITKAQGILSADQLAALQSLQKEQDAAAALREQMRAAGQNRPPATNATGPGGG